MWWQAVGGGGLATTNTVKQSGSQTWIDYRFAAHDGNKCALQVKINDVLQDVAARRP